MTKKRFLNFFSKTYSKGWNNFSSAQSYKIWFFTKNWNEPVFVVETWKKIRKIVIKIFQMIFKKWSSIFEKLYRDRPISASGPLSLLHVFHFPCSNNPYKYFDPNHRSRRKRGEKVSKHDTYNQGPHFLYWKALESRDISQKLRQTKFCGVITP